MWMCNIILNTLHAKLQTNVTAELMVDSMALQPFSFEEWKSHRDDSIAKVDNSHLIYILLTLAKIINVIET
jgi:hypothetical protein